MTVAPIREGQKREPAPSRRRLHHEDDHDYRDDHDDHNDPVIGLHRTTVVMMASVPRSPSSRVAVSLRLDPVLAERVREFVRDHAGKPAFLTMSSFAEAALEAHLAALSAELEGRVPSSRTSSPNHRA